MTVWLITGASRGFGLEIARQALERGDRVVAGARSPEGIVDRLGATDRLLPVRLDVTDDAQTTDAVTAAVDRFGGIDVLVNNAGHGLLGAIEEVSPAETAAVFAVNLDGALRVTRAVLPVMRAQRSGRIVMMSSLGGFAQAAGWGVYGATKFAIEGIGEALDAEVSPLGIRVVIVEPGSFRTDFLTGSSIRTAATRIPDYDGTVGAMRDTIAGRDGTQINDPVRGVEVLIAAVTADDPPIRLQLGPDAIAVVERKLDRVRADLETWRVAAASTRFPAAEDVGREGLQQRA